MQQQNSTWWLTEEQFERFVPANNYILVQSVQDMDYIEYKTLNLYINTTYNPEDHQEVINKVIRLPKSRICHSDHHVCNINVSEGDTVWVEFFNILNCDKVMVDGRLYRLIPFSSVYLSVSPDQAISMQNGYLLLDRIEDRKKSDTLELIEKKPPWYGKVLFTGEPVIEYIKSEFEEARFDINPGDILLPWTPSMRPFERAPHYHFDGKQHYVAQRNRLKTPPRS